MLLCYDFYSSLSGWTFSSDWVLFSSLSLGFMSILLEVLSEHLCCLHVVHLQLSIPHTTSPSVHIKVCFIY